MRAGLYAAILAILIPAAASAQSSAADYTYATRYDAAGRVTGTIAPDPDGPTGPLHYMAVRTTYDAGGRPVLVEKGELQTWQSESVAPSTWSGTDFVVTSKVETIYDGLDRKILETASGWDATLPTPTWVKTNVTQYSYDSLGRLECTAIRVSPSTWSALPTSWPACTLAATGGQYGADRITRNVYDAVGRVLRIQKAYGTPLQQDYVTYSYSENGKPLAVKDANGNVATYTYDGFDRLIAWAFPSKTVTGNTAACSLGTISETTDTFGVSVSGPADAATPGDDCEKYSYDRNGNRAKLVKRDARVFAYNYDNLNRLLVKKVPGTCVTGFACTTPPSTAVRDVHYGYNLQGLQFFARFDSATGTDGVVNVWDGFGRQKSETLAMGGVSRTVTYGYDLNGNRKRIMHPDGTFFMYNYDGLDRLYLVRLGNTTSIATMTYNADGQQSGETRGNVATTFGYDPAQRLKSLADDLAGGTTNDVTSTLAYSPANQVVTKTRDNPLYAWNGYTNLSRSYVTNGLNQYANVAGVTYGYDSNGNLASDGVFGYTYDAENRLVTDNAGTTLTYDPLGRLYKVATSTTAETYLYAGDQRIGEYDATGAMTARYVMGAGTDNPLIWYDGAMTTSPRSLQGDAEGSIVSVADASGAMIAINSYDEYGIPANSYNTTGSTLSTNLGRFGYTGQIWVPELGLWYYKARFYSPKLGRFMQADPVGYADQNNLYAYVGNDPLDGIDSTGKWTAVITLYDYGVGTHSAIMVVTGGQITVYDPAGGYSTDKQWGSGDSSTNDFPKDTIKSYIRYWIERGSDVRVQTLATTPAEDRKVVRNIDKLDNAAPFTCTSSVCRAIGDAGRLGGIGGEQFRLPGSLADAIATQTKIPLLQDRTFSPNGSVNDNKAERESSVADESRRQKEHEDFIRSHPGAG